MTKVIDINGLRDFKEILFEDYSVKLVGDCPALTTAELNSFFVGGGEPANWFLTEDFSESSGWTPQSWAEDLGFSDVDELLDTYDDDTLESYGSQPCYKTNSTIEYGGMTYILYDIQDGAMMGLMPSNYDEAFLRANSMREGGEGLQAFSYLCYDEEDFYGDVDNLRHTVVSVPEDQTI